MTDLRCGGHDKFSQDPGPLTSHLAAGCHRRFSREDMLQAKAHFAQKGFWPKSKAFGLFWKQTKVLLQCKPISSQTPPPSSQLFTLQLIKWGCLLSEDKVGYLLHLGAPECQRCTEFGEILAANKPEHMSAGSGTGGCAATTLSDPSSFGFCCSSALPPTPGV